MTLSEINTELCVSGIGKERWPIKLLQWIAQLNSTRSISPPSLSTLTTGLIAYFNLDAATGEDEIDSVGTLGSLPPSNMAGSTTPESITTGPGGNKAKQYGLRSAPGGTTASYNRTTGAIPTALYTFPFTLAYWMNAPSGNDTLSGGFLPLGLNDASTWGPICAPYYYFGTTNIGPKDNFGFILSKKYPLSALCDDNWHFLVFTFTASDIFLSVDGVAVTFDTESGSWVGTSLGAITHITIGSASYFDGLNDGDVGAPALSMVGIWNRVLTASEITQLYNSGNGLRFNQL